MHHNLKTATASALLGAISNSLFSDTAFTVLIFNEVAKPIKGPSEANTFLGIVEAIYGLSALLFALPIGYLADHYSRAAILRTEGAVELLAVILTAVFVVRIQYLEPVISFAVLCLLMALWGLTEGLSSGPVGALVADSVPSGGRSAAYTTIANSSLAGRLLGPTIIIAMTAALSKDVDEWDTRALQTMVLTGLGLHLLYIATLFLYRDIPSPATTIPTTVPEPFTETFEDDPDDLEGGYSDLERGLLPPSPPPGPPAPFCARTPAILFMAELVVMCGSGMTVKYWPLFFKNDCAMSMVVIQCIEIVKILTIILFQNLSQRYSKRVGRMWAVITVFLVGIAFQTVLAMLPSSLYGAHLLVGGLYVLRVAFMNCVSPLLGSALMDIVPKEHRARWESLGAVGTVGWSGSAFLGGLISDRGDYSRTFIVTSIVHLVGVAMFFVIRNDIPAE